MDLDSTGTNWLGDTVSFRWAILHVIEESTLHLELHRPASFEVGGRRGKRSAAFAALHDELTEVYRVEPNAAW